MKTTKAQRVDSRPKVNLNPNLYARAKALADKRGQSFSQLVEELIYREMLNPSSPYEPLEAAEDAHEAARAAAGDKPATARRPSGSSKG